MQKAQIFAKRVFHYFFIRFFTLYNTIFINVNNINFRNPRQWCQKLEVRNLQAYRVGSSSKISYRPDRDCKLSIEILKVFVCLNTEFCFENQVNKQNKFN